MAKSIMTSQKNKDFSTENFINGGTQIENMGLARDKY